MIGYKICLILGSKFVSFYFGRAGVEYEIGKVTKPSKGHGPLAVFKTLEDVEQFYPDCKLPIFKCKYTPSKRIYLFNGVRKEYNLPSETVLATKVELLERIQ